MESSRFNDITLTGLNNPLLFSLLLGEKYEVIENKGEQIDTPYKLFAESTVYDNVTPSDTEEVIFERVDPFYEDIKKKIYYLSFPNRWEKEGIAKPNIHSKGETVRVCSDLFKEYELIPSRIVPTKEEGVAVFYEFYERNRSLIIEIYNDLDIAALVNDNNNKSIVLSVDIRGLNFSEIIKAYCG